MPVYAQCHNIIMARINIPKQETYTRLEQPPLPVESPLTLYSELQTESHPGKLIFIPIQSNLMHWHVSIHTIVLL